MKRWVGLVLLGLSLWVTYEGWRNAQPERSTQDQARGQACKNRERCEVKDQQPSRIRADWFGREYEWKTSAGPVSVSCGRVYVFAGPWRCIAREGAGDGV